MYKTNMGPKTLLEGFGVVCKEAICSPEPYGFTGVNTIFLNLIGPWSP